MSEAPARGSARAGPPRGRPRSGRRAVAPANTEAGQLTNRSHYLEIGVVVPGVAVALLEQILAPALRSRNPERRKEAVEALENLAAISSHLKYLLLVRDLRKITS